MSKLGTPPQIPLQSDNLASCNSLAPLSLHALSVINEIYMTTLPSPIVNRAEYLLLVQPPVLFAGAFPVPGEYPVEVDTNTYTDESNTQEKER